MTSGETSMKLRFAVAALVAALAAPGLTSAPADPAELALEHSKALKQNSGLLREYSWKSRTEVRIKGEDKGTRLAQVRFDAKGKCERTPIGGETNIKKKRGLRGKVQSKKLGETKELTQGVATLVARYAMPSSGELVDFFEKATFSQSPAEGGSVQILGKGMHKEGDTVTMWVDPQTKLLKKLNVRTWIPKEEKDDERIWIEATMDYDTLGNGASYPRRSVVKIMAMEMRLVMEQFDHIKQGG